MDLTARLGRLRSIADLRDLLADLGHESAARADSRTLGTSDGYGEQARSWSRARATFPGWQCRRRLRSGTHAGWRATLPRGAEWPGCFASTTRRGGSPSRWPWRAPRRSSSISTRRHPPRSPAWRGSAGTGPGGALAYAARAADALCGEAVGRRFFREFKATLDRMADGLPTTLRGDDRRSLALLQLTRVLFLYFIQAKGWLAGRERFLGEEVDRCLARGRRLHRDLLRPLFFGTLNRAPADRGRCAAAFGAIPFLNGGLFEPHPLERRLRHDIPNAVWRDAFDRLFERFHFVVTERGAAGGIAPDMLGRVFEGVMAPDIRRASGTYYTPAALVRSILDAALTALAASRLGCGEGEAERRLSDRDSDPSVPSWPP